MKELVVAWRAQMQAAGVKTPVPLDELEVHLRDGIEQQMKLGSDEAEAFSLAAQKIGAAPLVQVEFNKIEEAKNARIWKRFEIVILASASLVSFYMGGLFLFKFASFSQLTPGEQMSGLAACVTLAALIWGERFSFEIFPAIRVRQIRDAIYIFSGVLLTLWFLICFKIVLANHDFPMGQLLTAILWGSILPMGAGMGFELGTRRRRFKNVVTVSL